MPWNPAQMRLFQAAAHNPAIAQSSGIPQAKAAQMASEGVVGRAGKSGGIDTTQRQATDAVRLGEKRMTKPQRLAHALASYGSQTKFT